jgi:hypothetical protein
MGLVISKGLTLRKEFQWNETVWNPSMISTALWLDAADANTITVSSGLVSQINDKSGSARNFTAGSTARPTLTSNGLNSRPVLTYDGSQYLTSANAASTWNFLHQDGGAEAICVVKVGNTSDPNTVYGLWGTNAGTVLNQGIYQRWDDRASSNFNDALITAAQSAGGPNQAIFDISSNNVLAANLPVIVGCSLNLGAATPADKTRHIVNGTVLNGNNTQVLNGTTGNAAFTLQIGGAGNNIWGLVGYVAEFLVFNYKLTTDTRQRIEGYLAHKWALTANLPSDHPYKTVGPTP